MPTIKINLKKEMNETKLEDLDIWLWMLHDILKSENLLWKALEKYSLIVPRA